MARLQANAITLSYGGPEAVVQDMTVHVPDGAVTAIIGPNGCGKSTLLRALARLMTPRSGAVLLDGEAIHRQPTRQVAKRIGLLPQQPSAPEAITVEDLVQRGRYPHQAFFQPPSEHDRRSVERALELAGVVELRHRPVDELSGGQRQRAWIAMALAQETSILLLDEPTTYLDIAHQQEVLALVRKLNREEERTIVLVVHDVNNAAQVSDHVVAMREGGIVAEGPPEVVLASEMLEQVFGVACDVVPHPETGLPVSVPRGKAPVPGKARSNGGDLELRAERLSVGYGRVQVVEGVSVSPPPGQVSAIVGPNACGKSTLLRAFARLLPPMEGMALLDGKPVQEGSHRDLARRLGLLSQGAVAPPGVPVEDLVAVGRYPYQRWYRQWSRADQEVVDRAMEAAGVVDLRWRPVDTLSGGQRQRVWLAMALAQETEVLLLDEPTTFLDIAHQVEVLDLVWELNRNQGRTVVMVLHDLGQACRYADYLVVMKDGRIMAAGSPNDIVTPTLLRDTFDLEACIAPDPMTGRPLVLPVHEAEIEAATVKSRGTFQAASLQPLSNSSQAPYEWPSDRRADPLRNRGPQAIE